MMRPFMKAAAATAVLAPLALATAQAQVAQPQPRPVQVQPGQPVQGQPAQVRPGQPGFQGQPGQPGQPGFQQGALPPGPIDGPQDLRETARIVFMVADVDGDGQISKQEATGAGNLVVGGFFFRADADGDGELTQDEAREAREEFLDRSPVARALVRQIRRGAGGNTAAEGDGSDAFRGLADLIAADNDKAIKATEVRKAVETGVEGIYAAADTNRDEQMSPAELNAAAATLAQTAARATFALADENNDGTISKEEFETAVLQPARAMFGTLDADGDGQISAEEGRAAEKAVMGLMRMAPGLGAPNRALGAPGTPGRALPAGAQPRPQPAPGAGQPAPAPAPGQPR